MDLPSYSFRATVRPWLVALVLVLASVFPVSLLFKEGPRSSVGADGQVSGKQGEVVLVTIPVKDRPDRIKGQFLKRTLTFFPVAEHTYAGLLGLDMQDRPGRYELTIEIIYPQRTERRSLSVLVMKEKYPEQRLTLPSNMVDLDQKTLARVTDGIQSRSRGLCRFRAASPVEGPVCGAGLGGKSPGDSVVAGSSTANPENLIAVKTSRRLMVRPSWP